MEHEQGDLFEAAEDQSLTAEVSGLLRTSASAYVKRLSLNDWQWTENRKAHQGGPYIPHRDRDGGFFPRLRIKPRESGKEIREAHFEIYWPQSGESKLARLVHYTSKGEETHLTGVPKDVFSGIRPASTFLLLGGARTDNSASYTGFVLQPGSDAGGMVEDFFELDPQFSSGVFDPGAIAALTEDKAKVFLDEALVAFAAGKVGALIHKYSRMPTTKEMAQWAQREYMKKRGLVTLDPFTLEAPGDALMQISRTVEYDLYKDLQLRVRSMQIVAAILGDNLKAMSVRDAFGRIITNYQLIDNIVSSAGQARRSRAGYSFEHHIERLLIDGAVPHDVQPVIGRKNKADFILPSLGLYQNRQRRPDEVLVLSAKTTLRERWKQVTTEIRDCHLYLATVDDSIASNAISGMAEQGIRLVVPESLKSSDVTVYGNEENVISFREFFHSILRSNAYPLWRARGISLTVAGN